jgi:hypothetical protein
LQQQRDAYKQDASQTIEAKKTEAILNEFKEKRGVSLMDKHLNEKDKKLNNNNNNKNNNVSRQPFDREKVFF